MSTSARVTSTQTIQDFRAALCRFAEDAKHALGSADMEIRRTSNWLLRDQPLYWKERLHRSQQDLAMAKGELFRRKLSGGASDEGPSTVVQKEAVRVATGRMKEAEFKLDKIKKWSLTLQHALNEYHGSARPLNDMIEGDVINCLALLDRMTAALDAYLAIAPPSTPGLAPSGGSGGGMASASTSASASPTTETVPLPETSPVEIAPTTEPTEETPP